MRRFLAIILILVFVIVTPAALALQSVKSTLLNPDILKQKLRDHKVYDESITIALDELKKNTSLVNDIPFFSSDDMVRIVKSIITSAWLQTQTESTIDTFFAWLGSKQDIRTVNIVIPLGDIKERTTGILTTEVQSRLNALPVCTPAELASGDQSLLVTRDVCLPPGVSVDNALKDMHIATFIDQIPDALTLQELISSQNDHQGISSADRTFSQMNRARDRISQGIEALKTLFVVLLMILLLIGALTMTSAKSFFGWVGFPLFLVGAILVGAPFIVIPRATAMLSNALANSNMTGSIQTLVDALAKDFLSYFFSSLRTKGIIIIGVGLLFIIIAFVAPKKKVKTKVEKILVPKMTLQEKFRS